MKKRDFEIAALGLLARNGEMRATEVFECLRLDRATPREITESESEWIWNGASAKKVKLAWPEVRSGLNRLVQAGEVVRTLGPAVAGEDGLLRSNYEEGVQIKGNDEDVYAVYYTLSDDGQRKRMRLAARAKERGGYPYGLLPQHG